MRFIPSLIVILSLMPVTATVAADDPSEGFEALEERHDSLRHDVDRLYGSRGTGSVYRDTFPDTFRRRLVSGGTPGDFQSC